MKRVDKVVVTCAVTGGVHTPSMSPYLPITADEIATSSVEAAEAGAAIIHLHARDPLSGRPSQDPDLFAPILDQIKSSCDAVVNITTGGGLGMPLDERLAPAHAAQPELASLNMGSMNFGIFKLAERNIEWKHDWEQPYLAGTQDLIYPNTFAMIERVIREVGHAYGTRFEFECYDVSHLYNLKHFVDLKLVQPPFLIQFILGVMGGIGAEPDHLLHMRNTADKLFGEDYIMSCIGVGKAQLPLLALSASMGGAVRVGLEDNLYLGRGELASSNADQVRKVVSMLDLFGLDIATPTEAREILNLKGAHAVAF